MKYFLLLCITHLYLFADANIFVYHRFGDSKHQSTNTTLKELNKEFKYLKDNGYKVVPMTSIVQKLKKKEEIPDKWVAFNIDDSYKSFYENGLPLFKKYNYPFTLFIYVKATEDKYGDFMSWKQIKEASKYGEIALHSYGHNHLTHLSNEAIYSDTKKSYDIFVSELGFKPKGYVYPYGEYDKRVKDVISKFDFDYIANQSVGNINLKSDVLDLNRIALVGKVNLKLKLKYKTLDAIWIHPKEYPKNGILKRINVKINPEIKNAKLYISGFGWKDIKVKNGIIDIKLNKKLKLVRNRVAISTDYYKISSKLLIK